MIPSPRYRTRLAGLLLILLCGVLLSGCNRSARRQNEVAPTVVPPASPTATSAPTPLPAVPTPIPTSTPLPPTPAELLAQAQLMEEQGYVEEATDLYGDLIRLPDSIFSSPAAYFLGRLLVSQEEWKLADDALELHFVMQGDAKLPDHLDYSSEAYLLWARTQRHLGSFESASNYYRSALTGLPALASDIHLEWGLMLLEIGQDDEGLAHLAQAAEIAYASHIRLSIQDQMALALEARERHDEAVAIYGLMLDAATEPAYRAQLQYRAGMALAQIQNEPAAIASFRLATETKRDSVHAYLALVELMEREVAFDPYTRGFIDYYAGAYDVAAQAFSIYRAQGKSEEFRAPYGEIYEGLSESQLGNYLQAEARLKGALSQYPECPCRGWAYQELLDLYLTVDNDSAYMETWETYIQELPTDPGRARVLAGQISRKLEEGERGAAYLPLQDLLGFFPESLVTARALHSVVMDALREQQYQEANSGLQQLRTKFPAYRTSEVGYWTAYTLWHAGHTDAALFGWERTARHKPVDFFSIMATQALRKADGASQDVIPDMPALSQGQAGLSHDAGTSAQALDWLRSWANRDQEAALPAPADDINMQRGMAFHRLGNKTRAFQNRAAAIETYRSAPYHLWDLALSLADQGSYQLSIRATYYLFALSPAEQVTELPLFLQRLLYPRPYRELVTAAIEAHGVPELYFYSLLRQESLFEPTSVSSAGAQGLGQIMPDTGDWIAAQLGKQNYESDWLQRRWLNLEFSAFYLSFVFYELDQNWLTALASYNAGPGTGRAFREISGPSDVDFYRAITLTETATYLRTVVTNLWHYTRLYE